MGIVGLGGGVDSWLGVDVRGYLTGGRCLGVVARGIDVRGVLDWGVDVRGGGGIVRGRCPGVVSWGGGGAGNHSRG